MKKLTTLSLLALAALTVTSCTKRVCCVVGPPDGNSFVTQKSQRSWIAQKLQTDIVNDSLYVIASVGQEHLSFHTRFNGVGKYSLKPNEVDFRITYGDDVTVVDYIADSTAQNVLNINEYSETTKVISGAFSLNMTRAPRYAQNGNGYPEKQTFNDGGFRFHFGK